MKELMNKLTEEIIYEECSKCDDWTPHKVTEEGTFCEVCGTEFKELEENNEI